MFFKILLSYFIPVKIHEVKSEINNNLEVTLNNGKLVLDSKNTNFSYGSLQRVLRIGLKKIGFENIRKFEKILILGVAGGSVIKTLLEEIKFKGKITGVEIDPETINLANKYFGLDKIDNLTIIIADAKNFIKQTNENYNLIIIDIFEDDKMPDFLFETQFITQLLNCLSIEGQILFNTIKKSKQDNLRNENFEILLNRKLLKNKILSNIEGKTNYLS